MNPVSNEMAAIAGTVMAFSAAILTAQKLASGKTLDETRVIINRSIGLVMCVATGVAAAVLYSGYPVEAAARGLTPYRYWMILAVAYFTLIGFLTSQMRLRPMPRTNDPFVT